jgi:hypothetical protein
MLSLLNNFLQSPVMPFPLGPNIFVIFLFSNNVELEYFLALVYGLFNVAVNSVN